MKRQDRLRPGKPIAPQSRQPAPPARECFPPSWVKQTRAYAHVSSLLLSQIVQRIGTGCYRIPSFQRAWTWTDGQILALLDSLQQGYRIGTLLLWEHRQREASRESFGGIEVASPGWEIGSAYVVDGQQRMGALYAAAKSGRFWFDLQAGCFVVGEAGPWMAPAEMVIARTSSPIYWYGAHAEEHGLDRDLVFDHVAHASAVLDHADVSAVVLPSDWTAARVAEQYRLMNSTGTPLTAAEVERATRMEKR